MLIYKLVNLLIHKLHRPIQLKFKVINERNVITYPYYFFNINFENCIIEQKGAYSQYTRTETNRNV